LAALGRHWTALAWAVAQAHAAVEIIGRSHPDLAARIAAGEDAVAVVEASAPRADITVSSQGIAGTIWRLDPAGGSPYVVVVSGETWLLPPAALRWEQPMAHTGMAGAVTAAAVVGAGAERLDGACADRALATLRLGGAAIAAGLSLEAAARSLEYASKRVQFGAPLTALPTVRQGLFEQAGEARCLLLATLAADPSDAVAAAAVLEAACEGAIAVTAAAVQSHGGYGYLAEYGIERMVRDAVSLRAATDAAHGARRAAAALASWPA
jgi:hypothetical protein